MKEQEEMAVGRLYKLAIIIFSEHNGARSELAQQLVYRFIMR